MTLETASEAYAQKDFAAARAAWTLLAHEGNAEAMFWLGELHYYGSGVDKDRAMAFSWYKSSAERGCSTAYFSLGFCYLNGQGTSAAYVDGVKYLQLSIQAGKKIAEASYYLARSCARGEGISQDHEAAIRHYRSAAEAGSPSACLVLATVLERGYLVAQDMTEALKWYGLAAEKGKKRAQQWLDAHHKRIVTRATTTIRETPLLAKAYQERARAYLALREYEKALMDAEAILPVQGYAAWAHDVRAVVFQQKENWPAVIVETDKAIEHDRRYVNAYVRRGYAHERQGDIAKAIADYLAAFEIDSTNEFARRALKRLGQQIPSLS